MYSGIPVRRVGERLPKPVKSPLVWAYNRVAHWAPARVSHRWWVKRTYIPHSLKERERLFLTMAVYAHVNRPLSGYYFEFGSCSARTMRLAWRTFHRLFDWHFVAFDSFEGFPEIAPIDKDEIFKAGTSAITEDEFRRLCFKSGVDLSRLTTIKGFYDKSLTAETARRFGDKKAAVIYVDCDLYTSTVPVLEFSRPFLQAGTLIVFDEWNCYRADPDRGERRAWREFCERHPECRFEQMTTNGLQMVFVCVAA